MADGDERRRAGRVLRFAVTGALLAGAPLGCGGGTPTHVNEPAPEGEHVNEPAPDETVNEPAPEDETVNEPAPEVMVNEPPPGAE